MVDGSVTIATNLDNAKLEKELAKVRDKIKKLEDSLAEGEEKKSPLAKQAEELETKLRAARAEAARLSQEWRTGNAQAQFEHSAALERVRQLTAEHDRVGEKIDAIDRKLLPVQDKLTAAKERAGGLAQNLAEASVQSSRMPEAIKRADDLWGRMNKRISALAGRVFVFSVIARAFRSLVGWMWDTIKTNDKAVKAMGRLQAALLTLAQPIVQYVIPAFTAFVNVLADAITMLASFVSTIFGTTLSASADAAEALNDQKKALSGVGSAAKKAGKDLAAFDEINQVTSDTSGGVGGSSIVPDFGELEAYKRKIGELEDAISAALLALGIILTFSGANIPLGLGLIAVGAAGLAASLKESWGTIPKKTQDAIFAVLLTLGVAAIVFGAVFLLTGHIGIGLGLIALGLSALWTADVLGVDWNNIPELVEKNLDIILVALGAFAAVIGVIFLLTGNIPLGLGLILFGLTTLWAADEVGFNWDSIPPEVVNVVGALLDILGKAAVIFGVVFLLTGNIPLGLGLIVFGMTALWAADKMGFDWGALPPEVTNVIGNILKILGPVAAVFGVIFLLTGNIPIGLGLILTGFTAIWQADKMGFNWKSLPPEVENVVTDILAILADAALVIGVILLFTNNIPIGLGLIIFGIGALWSTSVVAEDWGRVSGKVRSELETILKIIAASAMAVGVILLFTPAFALGISLLGMSAAAFFGLGVVSEDVTWGAITGKVSGGLDDVESEIESHTKSIRRRSSEVGEGLVTGTAEAVTSGEPVIRDAMGGTMEAGMNAAQEAVEQSESGVVGAYKSVYNHVLDNTEIFANRHLNIVQAMLKQTAKGLSALPDTKSISIPTFSMINVPRLATGAVIPPNREFMAVLGDQKRGTNIEAPMETIKEGVRQVLAENGGGGGGTPREITLRLIAGRGFVRHLRLELADEDRRSGVKLVQATT